MATGVGKMATTAALMQIGLTEKPTVIIQTGIAGAYRNEGLLGKATVVVSETLVDLGVDEGGEWKDLFGLGLADRDMMPFSDGRLVNENLSMFDIEGLLQVAGATVNTLPNTRARIEQIVSVYRPDIETMEGAALHYVGNSLAIPYLQIRGISNLVGVRDKSQWQIGAALAAADLAIEQTVSTILNGGLE